MKKYVNLRGNTSIIRCENQRNNDIIQRKVRSQENEISQLKNSVKNCNSEIKNTDASIQQEYIRAREKC